MSKPYVPYMGMVKLPVFVFYSSFGQCLELCKGNSSILLISPNLSPHVVEVSLRRVENPVLLKDSIYQAFCRVRENHFILFWKDNPTVSYPNVCEFLGTCLTIEKQTCSQLQTTDPWWFLIIGCPFGMTTWICFFKEA